MSDWLRKRLDEYHALIAIIDQGGTGRIVVGPIVATATRLHHPTITLLVGDCEIVVQATPGGRRVFVSIDDGHADVQTTRRHKNGSWS